MPCSVHTEPCSPGICGQQERLFPITGKYNSPAPIIGHRATLQPLTDTTLSSTLVLKMSPRLSISNKPTHLNTDFCDDTR